MRNRNTLPGGVRCAIVCAGILLASGLACGQYRGEFTSEAVSASIQAGMDFLLKEQGPKGDWGPYGDEQNKGKEHGWYPTGPTALATYALLEGGLSPTDKRMVKALHWLAEHKTDKTYCLGIRANVWLVANRKTRGKYRKHLEKDVLKLIRSVKDGHYTYTSDGTPKTPWDNSNCQYGLLGVWAGAQDNLEIPKAYWLQVFNHWRRAQGPDGGWSYRDAIDPETVPENMRNNNNPLWSRIPRATMTTAGLASMFVCIDNLFASRFVNCRGKTDIKYIKAGLDWMDKHFPETIQGSPNNYYLYGVERVGLASGYKYFGKHDWYKEGALQLMRHQRGGAWKQYNPTVGTSLGLLFLIRGQHPVVFNKLEFHGDWNNRPRDMASLTRWMSKNFERTLNWQIINLRVPESELHDAPFMYISGSIRPTFTDEEIDKLRNFVHQGGTIFSVTECNGAGFISGIRDVYKKLFPKYEMEPLKPSHPLYNAYYTLRGRPRLKMISNGVRPLVIHCDEDLARSWQIRATSTGKEAFQLGGNLILHVVGEMSDLRPRGELHWPTKPVRPRRKAPLVRIARIRYPGNWNPEPLVYERFARLIARDARLEITEQTLEDLPDSNADLAILIGTGPWKPSGQAVAQLKAWLAKGGTLLIDSAGGEERFARAMTAMVEEMYGRGELKPLPVDSPVLQRKGNAIEEVRYRSASKKRIGNYRTPLLQAVTLQDGRVAVLFSREDISTGLGGFPSGTVDGYEPASALAIMRNVVLYVAAHLPEEKTSQQIDQPAGATSQPAKDTPLGEDGLEPMDVDEIFEDM